MVLRLAQLFAVQFADLLQSSLELVEIGQAAAYLRDLIDAQSELVNSLARIAGGENPNGVPTASGALGAALFMTDGAMQQGAA